MKLFKTCICLLLVAITLSSETQPQEVNKIVDGKRQGFWHIENNNGKVEEGNYEDGKRVGEWKTFVAGGRLKSVVTFENGVAVGEATFYYADGSVMEHGFWNIDHWQGAYERYHPNGVKACQFTYDNRGRREGQQLYYHDNGKVMYEGTWNAGKINGALSIYDNQGRKTMERVYDESGKFQASQDVQQLEQSAGSGAQEMRKFTGTGQYTLFHLNGKVDQKGYFIKGVLHNGEHYVYNDADVLQYIEVYEGGVLKGKK